MGNAGAGGTPGGIGSFFIGFLMMCSGFYLLLQSIVVTQSFNLGLGLFHLALFGGPVSITSGMLLVPLILGIGMVFFDFRSYIGWLSAIGSLTALIVGVLVNLHFSFRTMSLFDLLGILILSIGGLGLFLRSFSDSSAGKSTSKEQL